MLSIKFIQQIIIRYVESIKYEIILGINVD